jgi:PIN domain nuclease of toxin-antitoxin system
MKYLLDTHTFLWWDMESSRLSTRAFALCQDRSNVLLLSIASVWEIQIKQQAGKLGLSAPLGEIIQKQRQTNGIKLLPIRLSHVLGLASLPDHHKDPFDRLLVAQATIEKLTLVSRDPHIAQYPIQLTW